MVTVWDKLREIEATKLAALSDDELEEFRAYFESAHRMIGDKSPDARKMHRAIQAAMPRMQEEMQARKAKMQEEMQTRKAKSRHRGNIPLTIGIALLSLGASILLRYLNKPTADHLRKRRNQHSNFAKAFSNPASSFRRG